MQYRRSIEFLYKDKRLRNAVPPQETGDNDTGPRFISKNPKLSKILKNKEKRRMKQSELDSARSHPEIEPVKKETGAQSQ